MKQQVGLVIWLALVPATLAGQTPPSSAPNGSPAGAWRPAAVEGQPIETRPPEKNDNKPAFPEQTRAPYHASAPFKVTTLIDDLPRPGAWRSCRTANSSSPNGCPAAIRILDTKGRAVRSPLAGVSVLMSPAAKDIGLLDVRARPALRHQPPNLLHLLRLRRRHRQQHVVSRGRGSTKRSAP